MEQKQAGNRLRGKVALVTGGGRGIGRAVCLKLASEGARLVINDLDAKVAHEIAGAIKAEGGQAVICAGSVTAPDFGDRFIATALEEFGDVDIIVNNAGFTWDGMAVRMSDEQFDAILDVHVKAPFRILRAAGRYFREAAASEAAAGTSRHRKVVNVSSIVGLGGNVGQINYSTAKAGIVGMTKTLAKEWGRFLVNVNAVAFGLIETRLTAVVQQKTMIEVDGHEVGVGMPAESVQAMRAAIPFGRAGTPEEAAGAIFLLCLPEADYISGQVIAVTGGMST
ncbi:beta-ketoacyl-ACP reductase [Acidocella aquatica]|uniref:Beta-ketoacyl-ACP reductase n=1 Tax=Acidocella aquatica TaxID=1922313 RepID=A0ABQ6A7D2_9PROT|nr:SDR family oxidoreductase [Acidocella aquatica]GLR68394.1 beta-ketoacyl-ACP reductase [Acidocella aquatica]